MHLKLSIISVVLSSVLLINALKSLDNVNDFYTLHAKDSRGISMSLEKYRGKFSLITNVASECGYTDMHYEAYVKMQTIFNKHRSIFNVLAFPCNQFGQQEPNSVSFIIDSVKEKYSANFPIFDKTNTIGPEATNLWKQLANKYGKEPTWNFWKYLIHPNGTLLETWNHRANLQNVFKTIKKHIEQYESIIIRDEL